MTANGNWTKEENLAYAAGFIDGEGSFNVYPNDRKNYPNHLTFQLEAGNTDRDLLASFRSVVGAGKVTVHPWKNKLRRKPMWGFKLRSRKQVHDFAVLGVEDSRRVTGQQADDPGQLSLPPDGHGDAGLNIASTWRRTRYPG